MAHEPIDEKAVFNHARGLASSEERLAYLQQACGNDADARRRILDLLRVYDQEKSFLESPALAPGATMDEPVKEKPGTMIGPYKLLEQIGEGGFGVVYMAEQTEPVRRKVALKILKPGMDTKQVVARFEAERQALAIMDHPNIAKVHDGGATPPSPPSQGGAWGGGRPYFVMELVKGVPITEFCDQNHLTPRQRLELFIPVCQAVQHAHQKGIIHRDLKPSNILVVMHDTTPVPKIIDFGIAKALGQELTDKTLFTGFAQMVGTPLYMSPEQAGQSGLDIDTRSDIYSLGVLLYELLTGTTPFDKERFKKAAYDEIRRIIREEDPPKPSTRLSALNHGARLPEPSHDTSTLASVSAVRQTEPAKLTKLVRGELDWIVMKALEKDRNRRYETANGFAMDVQRYLADEPVQACPPSAGYRLRKFARRNKGPVFAASLVVAVLLIGIVGTTWGMIRATDAEADALREAGEKTVALREKEAALTTARTNETKAQKQESLAKEQELLARRRFYAVQINLAQQAWEAGQPARALELLESQRPKFDEEDLRGFDWYYLWRRCQRNLHLTLNGREAKGVYALAVTPDGQAMVSSSHDASVRVWDVATGTQRALLTGHRDGIWRLAISPDGKLIASASNDGTVKLWRLGTSELVATLVIEGASAPRSVAFSPHGEVLAVGTEAGTLELWDMATRQRRLTLPAHSAPTVALAYSPDGKMLASGAGWNTSRGRGGLKVWDMTSNPFQVILQQAPLSNGAAFSPDGKLMATCNWEGAKVWSVPLGELKATLASPGCSVTSLAFAVDGKTLVLGCNDRTVKLWEYATGVTRTVGVHLGTVNTVAFIPRSNLLASGGMDGTVKVWHASPPQDAASLAHKSVIRSLAFTPDGKLLVVGSGTTTTVLDAITGKETATLPVKNVLAASTDANLLAGWAADDKRVIWDVAAGKARTVLPVGPKLAGAAFARDGKTLVTWILDSDAPERAVRLWDLERSRVRLALNLAGFGKIHCAAFSPDSRTLATGRQFGWVTLWDTTTGQQRMTLQPAEAASRDAVAVAFSKDGTMLAAGNSGGTMRLWNLQTGQLKASFKGHTQRIQSLAFSPDGKTLLSGSADKTARLWDSVTGQELLTLKEHEFPVDLVAFAPDGKRLVTASQKEVKLWFAATQPEATAYRLELDPDDAGSPRALSNWGDRLQQIHQAREADNAYRKARVRLEELATALPEIPEYRLELAYNQFAAAVSLSTDRSPAPEEAHRRVNEAYQTLPPHMQRMLALRFVALSRQLASAPDPTLRNLTRAVELAKKAVEFAPEWEIAWQYLGWFYYRTGNWRLSIEALEKACELQPGGTGVPNQWLVLALAHAKLGAQENVPEKQRRRHRTEARRWYELADKQFEPSWEDIWDLRTEAKEVMDRKHRKN